MDKRRELCSEKCARRTVDILSPRLKGKGPKSAKIMLVGEAPGQREDEQGLPFIGSSGQLLDELLDDAGISRKKIYITNAVKCATPSENQKPNKAEITACRRYLLHEIQRLKPNVIGVLGAVALESVLRRAGITKLQNNVFFSKELKTKVVPVLHPAYILRNPAAYDALLTGLKLIKKESKSKQQLNISKIPTKRIDAKTPEKIDKILSKLEDLEEFVFDLETTSLDPREAKIILVAVSWKKGLGIALPWKKFNEEQRARFQEILLSKKRKIGQGIKFDIQVFRKNGVKIKGPFFDTLPAVALINENLKDKGLEALTLRYLDLGEYWAELEEHKEAYIKEHKIKKDEFRYHMLPYKVLAKYAQNDADATFRLYKKFKKELERQNLEKFYKKFTIPTLKVMIDMELRGIKINRKKLKKLITEYTKKADEAYEKILALPVVRKYENKKHLKKVQELTQRREESKTIRTRWPDAKEYVKQMLKDKDWKFNPQSTKQLREILYDMLDLNVINKTDKGLPSTNEETLVVLAGGPHNVELAQYILEHRKLVKYLKTYLVSVYEKSELDGRIHASYHQHRTVTGRLASSDPNMQNIPRGAEDFKSCFLADKGMTIIKADLAQAEFRCWAHYAKSEDMIADIESGMDIHRKMASEVFSIPEDEVTKEQRTAAKNCVTGDTWIPTPEGFKRIRTLNEGDQVLDHFNRTQTINETITKEDDVYLLETECGSVKCTKDHPFYLINEDAKPVFIPLSKLNPGDYILACTPENRKKEYVTWQYTGHRNTSFRPLRRTWTINTEIGYLLGFILAEGSISTRARSYSAQWSQKGRFVGAIDKLSTRVFKDRVKKVIDKRTDVVNWVVSSLEFVEFLKYTGMCTDNKKGFKKFPAKIIESPPDVQKAFLQGYFLGDGTFKNHRACVGTVSKEVRDGVCLILRNFGIYPKVNIEHPKGGADFYNIQITTNEELDILTKKLEVPAPEGWTPPTQNNGRKFLHNVNNFYQTKHPDCDVRYHVKLRDHITHLFLKKNCLGVNPEIDKLIEHGIYSVRINSITKLGNEKVYDFVTTGNKVMVANSLISLDCVFGLMYGRGTKAISKQYGISEEAAEEVRDLFFNRYPRAKIWLDKQVQHAREFHYVKTWMGRIRRLPEIASDEHMIRAEAERQAKNAPIQGLASDMNNHFMVKSLQQMKKKGIKCFPMTTVHDANFIQVDENKVTEAAKIMQDVVDTAFPDFKCAMKLDFEIGKTLGTLSEVDFDG